MLRTELLPSCMKKLVNDNLNSSSVGSLVRSLEPCTITVSWLTYKMGFNNSCQLSTNLYVLLLSRGSNRRLVFDVLLSF
jgi:hypothetical protein